MRQANVQFASILTKIGNGDRFENDVKTILEFRFCTKSQAQCPSGIHLFHTNKAVQEHNNCFLNRAEDKIVSTAKDVFVGCASTNQ